MGSIGFGVGLEDIIWPLIRRLLLWLVYKEGNHVEQLVEILLKELCILIGRGLIHLNGSINP